jgi:hypothetical protein
MYLLYFKREVVFYSQKVDKLDNSMGFVVGSRVVAGLVGGLMATMPFIISIRITFLATRTGK